MIGQARANAQLDPEQESRWMAALLTHWALRNTLGSAEVRAPPRTTPIPIARPTL